MNWQHLNYFRAVAETQNFTQSARELYCSTSTLSKAISSLEEELGFPLFVRSGRNSVLTENGRIFKEYVDRSMALIEEGIVEIRSQIDGKTGSFKITGVYMLCLHYLPAKMRDFLAMYPDINISLHQHFSADILELILGKKYDLGFCADFDRDNKKYQDIRARKIGEEEMVFVVPATHRFADRKYVTLDELREERFIISSNRNALNRTMFFDFCRQQKFEPNIAFEVPEDSTIINMLRAGLGISCMVNFPESGHEDLKVLRLKDSRLVQSFFIIWNKEAYIPPAARLFREFILSGCEESDPEDA